MSRKDTIIIALLVNSGLLALLFMLAVNTDEDGISDQPEINQTLADSGVSTPVELAPTGLPMANDEVDNFIKELSTEDGGQPIVLDEEGYVEFAKTPSAEVKPAQANAQPADDAHYVEVTVKRGDALEKIARSNGVSIDALKKANNLTSNKLSIGQVLRVPLSKKTTADMPATTKPNPVAATAPPSADKKIAVAPAAQYYTVKSGDSPWKIAKQNNVKFEDLLKLNGLDEDKARNLKPGDKIRIK